MKVAILGSGEVGQTLGAGFLKHGHQVMMGTRDPKKEEVAKWVAETPVMAIAQLRYACWTYCSVRRDLRVRAAARTLGNSECAGKLAAVRPAFDPVDSSERLQLSFDAVEQRSDARSIAVDPQQHAFAVIENFAGKPQFARNAPNGGPKADALHAAAYTEFKRLRLLRNKGHHVTGGCAAVTCC